MAPRCQCQRWAAEPSAEAPPTVDGGICQTQERQMAIMARRTATRSVRTRRRASTACQLPNSPSPPCHSTIPNRAPSTRSRVFTKRRGTGHSRHTIRNSKATTRSPCHSLKATSEPTSRFPRILLSPAARKTCTDTAMFGADRKDRRHSRDYALSERCRSFRSCFSSTTSHMRTPSSRGDMGCP